MNHQTTSELSARQLTTDELASLTARNINPSLETEISAHPEIFGNAGQNGSVAREVGVDVSTHRFNLLFKLADTAQCLSKLLLNLAQSSVIHSGNGVVMPNDKAQPQPEKNEKQRP